jgi:hypothetical protein
MNRVLCLKHSATLAVPATLADRPIYLEIGNTRSIIHGDWQYIAFRPSPAPDIYDAVSQPFINVNLPHKPAYFDADQLYDLAADPFCKVNLATDPAHAATVERLRVELGRVTATLPRPFPLPTSPSGPPPPPAPNTKPPPPRPAPPTPTTPNAPSTSTFQPPTTPSPPTPPNAPASSRGRGCGLPGA